MVKHIYTLSDALANKPLTTLANPEVVDTIREQVQSEKTKRGERPRELTTKEQEEIKAFGKAE